MAFISLHAKLQFPSSTIVYVTADGVISRVELMLPSYEAWCSAREGSLSCSASQKLVKYLIRGHFCVPPMWNGGSIMVRGLFSNESKPGYL